MLAFAEVLVGIVGFLLLMILVAGTISVLTCYRKVEQGRALVRNGMGGTKVSFSGIVVFPVIHRSEVMDISVKRVEIDRNAKNGLICMDNLRADIKVAFFVRVNQTPEDVLRVAQAIGCDRASSQEAGPMGSDRLGSGSLAACFSPCNRLSRWTFGPPN